MGALLLLVVAVNLGQESGAFSELGCEHTVDPLLGLLLSPQHLKKTAEQFMISQFID